ncbi:hypothetical protein ACDN41_11730 [Priestia aryabhattai]|uniref:hypothetical protein n=1 Tax=Priestia aryabhattai TaxID=412384 RepID=UPI0035322B65
MKKLVVFNTYEEKMAYFNKCKEGDFSSVSLEEGAGRINAENLTPFDLVVFNKSQIKTSLERHLELLERFYKDLEFYALVHKETKFH